MRTAGIVIGVVIVLIILGKACGGGTGGSGGSTTGSETTTKETTKQQSSSTQKKKQAQETTVGIGQPVTAGNLQWTITNAQYLNQLTSQFREPKQGNFVVVDFDLLNNGNEAARFTQSSLSLHDGQGRTADPDTDTFGYIDSSKNILLKQVNPGVTQPGQVIFSVAPTASGFTLEVGDAEIFSNKKGYVGLGF